MTDAEDPFLRDAWYLAALSREVRAGRQVRRILLDQPLLIGRTPDGEAFALRDVCPHRLVPLSAGRQVSCAGEPSVECPYHGWRFGARDGVCKLVPSLTEGHAHDISRIRVATYAVREAHGAIFVSLMQRDGIGVVGAGPPIMDDLPGPLRFSISQRFDLAMDVAAARLMAAPSCALTPGRRLACGRACTATDDDWKIEARRFGWARIGLAATSVGQETVFELPGYRWDVLGQGRARRVMLTCLTPEAPTRTLVTQLAWWRSAPLSRLARPRIARTARSALERALSVEAPCPPVSGSGSVPAPDWSRQFARAWRAAQQEGRDFANPVSAGSATRDTQ